MTVQFISPTKGSQETVAVKSRTTILES